MSQPIKKKQGKTLFQVNNHKNTDFRYVQFTSLTKPKVKIQSPSFSHCEVGSMQNVNVFHLYLCDWRDDDRTVTDSQFNMTGYRTWLLLLTLCWAGEDCH